MREILFRGKRFDKCEWVEGNLFIPDKEDTPTQICIGTNVIRITYDIIPETIGQYTGLNVGNEKLFEGDIVEWHEDYDDTWGYSHTTVGRSVVIWDKENFCWAFKTDTEYIQSFNDWNWDNSYIIGNIHDNPELLKESDNDE